MIRALVHTLCALVCLAKTMEIRAQVVEVTAHLDTNVIAVGQNTTLHIYAQVLPAYRSNADRIFSWYVDVLNTNGTAAVANFNALQKPASDNDPTTSSTGFIEGSNLRGIYDTFLDLPGAGTTNPVELISVPIVGVASGRTGLQIQHGTGVPNLSEDFIVAPNGGGDPMMGGQYSAAFADLRVVNTNLPTRLSIAWMRLADGRNQVTLAFLTVPDYDFYLEFRDSLSGLTGWQSLPGGPHNTGLFIETNTVPIRFYRVRSVLAP